MRPDICFVTTAEIYSEYKLLESQQIYGDTVGFHALCEEKILNSLRCGDHNKVKHWRLVYDFGVRHACSPLSGVEVDGCRMHEHEEFSRVSEEDIIHVYIGNPLNPPHEDQQPEITKERMYLVNQNYDLSVQ